MSLLQVQGDFRDIVGQYRENPYPALVKIGYSDKATKGRQVAEKSHAFETFIDQDSEI